jgi:Uma2 family endonuclease
MSTPASRAGTPPAVLHDIDWRTYTRLLRAFEGRRRFRLTYDRGTLEIMAPLLQHEGPAYLLGRFIDVLTEELRLPCRAGRSVTLRRRRKRRGLEPDNCYWIANAPALQGKKKLDLRVDPPPDLAIEVDVTSSSLDRMSIYLALGVPEVWRLSESGLTSQVLRSGAYQAEPNSLAFPTLAAADLPPFLAQFGQTDDTTLAQQFRDWVRQQLLPRSPAPPAP